MAVASAFIKLVDIEYSITIAEQRVCLLNKIQLSIPAGSTIAITGASGSGKTSLLTIMAGLMPPTSGTIWHNQTNLNQLTEDERALWRAKNIGFVFQFFHLLPNLTALENVMLPLEIQYHPKAKMLAQHWLAQVGLSHRTTHLPAKLSGGEQQRVAIARAFATNPGILFADEPTGNLDKKTAQAIIDLLFDLNAKEHTTLIMVTHDQHLAHHCQQRFKLEDGQLLC